MIGCEDFTRTRSRRLFAVPTERLTLHAGVFGRIQSPLCVSKLSLSRRPWRLVLLRTRNPLSKLDSVFSRRTQASRGSRQCPAVFRYKVLREGSGKSPQETDVVVVNYRGTLINGKEFDSSEKAGRPAEFPLNRVIPGWTEGVQLMKEGAKYEFFIPPNLAYGSRGAGGLIGPDETLIFEVELLKVK